MVDTKLCKLYDRLDHKNITAMYYPSLEQQDAISLYTDDEQFWIGLNPRLKLSEREELCVLMEEEAHYDAGIIPNDYKSDSYCDMLAREKNELRAKKLAVRKLVPREKLLKIIKDSTYIDAEELADAFEVTPDFIIEALYIYGLN